MWEPTAAKDGKSSRRERVKRYIVYALLLLAAAVLIYVFVWFGAQLGLQN